MAMRKVIIWPDPRLREVARPVERIDSEVRALAQDLLDTMHNEEDPGIGLAATQLGVPKRMFTVEVPAERGDLPDRYRAQEIRTDDPIASSPRDEHDSCAEQTSTPRPLVCINPEFTHKEGKVRFEEGCLSLPGEKGVVERAARVVIQYTDLRGERQRLRAGGLLSICLQHEYDHLDGKLWVDYQSRFKREIVRRKMLKRKRAR
ncbi:MAG: peptide deformylase [Myxococcota bacterium]